MIKVNCDNCGLEIDRANWQIKANKHHFCNKGCRNEWQSERMSGSNNPAWTGKQEAIICKVCGNTFYRLPEATQYQSKICSRECATKYYVGENSPMYGREREKYAQIVFNCDCCGIENSQYKSHYDNQNHHFCNTICRDTFVKAQVSKQDKEILKNRYSPNIRVWKRLCLERDNEECQVCSSDIDLRIHHLNSFTRFPKLQFNLDNGVTMCEDCHREFHSIYGIRKFTEEDYYKFMEELICH